MAEKYRKITIELFYDSKLVGNTEEERFWLKYNFERENYTVQLESKLPLKTYIDPHKVKIIVED